MRKINIVIGSKWGGIEESVNITSKVLFVYTN